ncbi:MAG: hypothetical protein A2096_06795 [Spirochaetes bacterium GWF1_41_5]|nr:MAG: hypothetical protein A2096_06795 [Spirochaetes bacterium GWF1_41_5]HBE02280.1 hypothetical protein [Spirochaetia bacterium]
MTENKILMQKAREALKGKWGFAVWTNFVYFLVTGAINAVPGAGTLAALLVCGPMNAGLAGFYLKFSRGEQTDTNHIFREFENFGNTLAAFLLMVLFIILRILLFIVPGIMAALSYSQIFYILSEDRSIAPLAALKKSKQMMNGYKKKLFYLGCRFFGWALLCLCTCGIGFLWLAPYINLTLANFYNDLKNPVSGNT